MSDVTTYQSFINGAFVASPCGATRANRNPANNALLSCVPESDANDVRRALEKDGAEVLTGGQGDHFEPTVLAACTPDMGVMKGEIFGPVLPPRTRRNPRRPREFRGHAGPACRACMPEPASPASAAPTASTDGTSTPARMWWGAAVRRNTPWKAPAGRDSLRGPLRSVDYIAAAGVNQLSD